MAWHQFSALGRYSALVSDDKRIGEQRSKGKRTLGISKGNESQELVFRYGDDVFVLMDGRMLPVDTSPQREHGLRRYTRTNKSAAGKILRDGNKKPQVHSLEARIYIGSSDAVEVLKVLAAYTALMREFGFERVEILDVEPGSVWLKLKQTYKKIVSNAKVRLAATMAVGGVEAGTVEKFQAENTATHMNAVANLVEQTKHMETFSFDSGPLQFVQWQDENGKTHGAARVVSSKDIAAKRLDEEIVKNPQKMIEYVRQQPDAITAASPSDE